MIGIHSSRRVVLTTKSNEPVLIFRHNDFRKLTISIADVILLRTLITHQVFAAEVNQFVLERTDYCVQLEISYNDKLYFFKARSIR